MWIIQLQAPEHGVRYYTSRGNHVTLELAKAKRFKDRAVAEEIMATCTLWKERRLIEVKD